MFGIVGLKTCSSYEYKQLYTVVEVQYNYFIKSELASGAGCTAC